MVYSLAYRRPARAESRNSTLSDSPDSAESSIKSGTSGGSRGIPEALSFDRIINGGTCPPCTTRDFMNYLIYIERAAENLQFFLWYRNYSERFAKLSDKEKALAPEWTAEQAESALANAKANAKGPKPVSMSKETAEAFKDTSFANGPTVTVGGNGLPVGSPGNPFDTPSKTSDQSSIAPSDVASSRMTKSSTTAAQAFENADLKWQPFTIQPYREEINRVISTYITKGAARELNMSGPQRIAVLNALEHTTHPSAVGLLVHNVESSLRRQAHPNFVRWTICNGNRPRVFFARFLGVFTITCGFAAIIVLTLSSAPRAWRALSAIGFVIGIATLIAAWKGMCVVLHGMHHRHLRPWELFDSPDDESQMSEKSCQKTSMESFGSSNSFEDEPWVIKYEKRNVVRKVFDREVWIEEPALRSIQDTIFIQAILGALLLSAVIVGVFCAIPAGNFF